MYRGGPRAEVPVAQAHEQNPHPRVGVAVVQVLLQLVGPPRGGGTASQ
ncbi:hypothetical protein HMPREF1316_1842 [Olsenella profusa F0195]|uniref:Uncharacterized protein n=1 Tax=Olsenella profusa F0195 TaxID=1125712 RepID=U2TTC3_9ACTN|nr:hypothetical protein HMPREF1316_1842 [Olsenella profusa F0195]